MFKIRALAGNYYTLKRRMQRARHLYALFCRQSIQKGGTEMLRYCARRMMFSGLKKTTNLADAEFSLLRHLFHIDMKTCYHNGKGGDPFAWHRWLRDHRWSHSSQRCEGWIKEAA